MRLRGEAHHPRELIDLAANVEAAAIEVPTGKQDHIAAVHGGLSFIDFGYRGYELTTIRDEQCLRQLEEMLILSYTGQGHFSGMNNWEVTKRFIDKDPNVRDKLIQIRDISRKAASTLRDQNWSYLSDLIQSEWDIRRTLAPGVSTAPIEAMMEAARSAGALANKVCGAGGGGCMITLVSPNNRSKVVDALAAAGADVIDIQAARQGITVRRANASHPLAHRRSPCRARSD
jgi:D-glycero-alpha-D-manno-heptose-7-phosphate kinase